MRPARKQKCVCALRRKIVFVRKLDHAFCQLIESLVVTGQLVKYCPTLGGEGQTMRVIQHFSER